ncbi:MAG: hypothetical protein M0Q01_01565 [Syntrophales bacterium]|jgi:hypothetical protein|nr:hypothetical protein [Syntrophales bacterium]
MANIEIDDDVFNYLKSIAEPFVDTPNTVLRRLLLREENRQTSKSATQSTPSFSPERLAALTQVFMSSFLRERYGEEFRVKSPFRTMFESEKHLIYFQNFNKIGTTNLWYRLSESSLSTLRKSTKIAVVCFTNASEKIIIEVPMSDIDDRIAKSSWNKEFLEVNIDPTNLRWRELDWNLQSYLSKGLHEEVTR